MEASGLGAVFDDSLNHFMPKELPTSKMSPVGRTAPLTTVELEAWCIHIHEGAVVDHVHRWGGILSGRLNLARNRCALWQSTLRILLFKRRARDG